MSSCAASCCTCFRKVSCAFATSDSSPTAGALHSSHFAFICSAQHNQPNKHYRPTMTRTICDSAQNVVDRCGSSKGLLLTRSNFVLLPPSSLPHETTLYNANLLPASAPTVFLCLAVLHPVSSYFLNSSLHKSLLPSSPFHLSVSSVLLCRTASAH